MLRIIRQGMAVAVSATAMVAVLSADAAELKRFGDGMYRVPRDVPAATYRSLNTGGSCYWARLRNFSGGLNSIIANENPNGPALVTIRSSDRGFESSRCGLWTSNLTRITKSRTRFGAGTYIVSVDIVPGTYAARGSGCYWARLRSFSGGLDSIIANANPSGRAIVTISRGDRGFTSSRCGTWSRF